MVEGGSTPLTPPDTLKRLGFSVAIYPLIGLTAAAAALQEAYSDLQNGTADAKKISFEELNRTVGFERIWAMDGRFDIEK